MKIDVQQISRLRVEPGDTLVIRSPKLLSSSEYQRFADRIARQLPGVRFLILDRGQSVDVISTPNPPSPVSENYSRPECQHDLCPNAEACQTADQCISPEGHGAHDGDFCRGN